MGIEGGSGQDRVQGGDRGGGQGWTGFRVGIEGGSGLAGFRVGIEGGGSGLDRVQGGDRGGRVRAGQGSGRG